ncbi:MAG: hypothetical protein HOP19_20525 [Acidobacteria bacterium]|nr:hypothetical protein [Acidobacteriota bacterium]
MMKSPTAAIATNQLDIAKAQARARVNRFLLSAVGSQFAAGNAEIDRVTNDWKIPILLVTPGFVAGQVGEACVSWHTHEIISHTLVEQIYAEAETLKQRYDAEIQAAFLQAGNR